MHWLLPKWGLWRYVGQLYKIKNFCFLELQLGESSCSENSQCSATNAECSGGTCQCLSGFYDTNEGQLGGTCESKY